MSLADKCRSRQAATFFQHSESIKPLTPLAVNPDAAPGYSTGVSISSRVPASCPVPFTQSDQ
jgi:hypothetical protein